MSPKRSFDGTPLARLPWPLTSGSLRKGACVEVGDTVFVTWVPRNPTAAASWRGGYALDLGDGTTASTADVFTWATHTVADESLVVKAPKGAALDVTSIIGCAVMTGAGAVMNTADVKAGQSVAIFGFSD